MSTIDIWTYRSATFTQADLVGLSVEAVDGSIGKIDGATNEVGASYIVVDTGKWIFGKKLLLPAGVIDKVDFDTETVFVNRTKEQIGNAPEYDEDRLSDDAYAQAYRGELGGYYGTGGPAHREDRQL